MRVFKLGGKLWLPTILAIMLAGLDAAHADPIKVRLAYVVPVSNWATLFAEKKDLAKHWGTSYDFEAVRYQGTPPMITAMAVNELEIGDLAYSTLGLAIRNAGLNDLEVIADEFQDGARPVTIPTSFSCARMPASTRSKTSKAKSSPPTPPAAASTSP